MSKAFDTFIIKLIAVVVILSFVTYFGEAILTDSTTKDALFAMMEALPFAKLITRILCNTLKLQYNIPLMTASSVLFDICKLTIMACLQPIAGRLVTRFILGSPNTGGMSRTQSILAMENYTSRFGYRLKSVLVTVLLTPLLAVLAANLTTALFNWATNTFGTGGSILVGLLSTQAALGLSAVLLVTFNITLGTALLWVFGVDLLGNLLSVIVTSTFCLYLYLSITTGNNTEILKSIIALVVWLIIMDFGMGLMRGAIVSR
ncbi:MAG: hypothetical protein IJB15_05840 [Clostridia bacterium]|nr:hypothetical protein [Clostridia bacterium]